MRRAVLFCPLILSCATALAADQKQGVSLDTYVRQLGYQGAKWEENGFHRPLVAAKLSNGKDVVCLVDTGDTSTTVSESSAKGLKTLGQLGVEVQDRVFGHLTNSDILILETLTVGPATFYNQPARLLKVKTVMPFTATLGCDFLVRNYCLLDFGGRFIYFRSGKPSAEQTEALDKSLRNSGFREVTLPKGWPLRLDAEINGSPVLLALHTGTVLSILDESQIKHLHLPIIQADTDALIRTDARALLVTSQGKTGQLRMVTASTFSVGNEQWSNVHFGAASTSPIIYAPSHQPIQGVLGPDFLTSHAVVWDFSTRKLWLFAGHKRTD